MLSYKPVSAIENYKYQNYIIEDTGKILTGWPARLNPNDFRFSAMHNGWIVVSFVPMYKPLPQSNVFKSELLEWLCARWLFKSNINRKATVINTVAFGYVAY